MGFEQCRIVTKKTLQTKQAGTIGICLQSCPLGLSQHGLAWVKAVKYAAFNDVVSWLEVLAAAYMNWRQGSQVQSMMAKKRLHGATSGQSMGITGA